MNTHQALAIATRKVMVEISLSSGASLSGNIYVPDEGRLSDVLNDDRGFLPVECADGSFVAISKHAIERVTLPAAEATTCRSDPFASWITLTDTQNRAIYVNMDRAISLKRITAERRGRTAERTAIGFSGSENEPLLVVESPEEILALISAAKQF
jgi:hypothetical protein